MAFNRFIDLSQDHDDTQFQSIFSETGLQGSTNLRSLSAESSEICRFVRYKLGEPVLTVELDNSQIDSAFEEANLELSRLMHVAQIANNFATMFGLSQDYTNNDLKTKIPTETWNYLRKYTKNFGIFGPNPVGGNVNQRKGWFQGNVNQQEYNINTDLIDEESGLPLGQYILTSSMSANKGVAPIITKLHHYPPVSLFRYFDPWSNLTVLNQEFHLESYTMGGQYYVLPVWNDILRGQVFKQSDLVRRSNFSYSQFGNRLQIMPSFRQSLKMWFEWFVEPDAMSDPSGLPSEEASLSAYASSSIPAQINAFWNVPITDIHYNEMNPVYRQWVRQYTVALCKEMLGLVRNKFSTVPIPNGDVTLNGAELISQAQSEMQRLREEMKENLEQYKKENLMKRELDMAENAVAMLKTFPLGGPILG